MNLESYLSQRSARIDRALEAVLPKGNASPAKLSQAMRYAVLTGGKRIRPIFVLAACEAVGGDPKKAMPAALALELIHSYSLVHDDLPCMDNDLVRRGKPSCHAKFGEVTALLAGDALLTQAFKVLGQNGSGPVIQWVADAVGFQGMVGGQSMDMDYQGRETEMNLPTIEAVNARKSGALIAVSLKAGAYLGGGSATQVESLYRYGKAVGLLFQVVDDIMDKQGYARVIGISEATQEAQRLLQKAKSALKPFKTRGETLSKIADFVATRKN